MIDPSAIESVVISSLTNLDVAYDWLEVDPAFADTAQFCAKYGFLLEESGNTIIVTSKRGEKKYCACIVLGTDRLDVNKKVRDLMDVPRLSFASQADTTDLTSMMIGGVTPFGLPSYIPIFVDQKVMFLERLILGGGSRSAKIVLKPQELRKIPSVRVIEHLSLDQSAEKGR